MEKHPLRVGLFGIGLEAYWPQFEGLKTRLEGYLGQVAQKLGRRGVEVCNLGLIDSPEKAMEAGHAFRQLRAGWELMGEGAKYRHDRLVC